MSNPHSPSFAQSFAAGVRRHAVALISLAVALFGTSYNTWRNQTTEAHRNTRAAAFMVLDALGQLQEISDRRFYGSDHSDANFIAGWGKVNVVRDMSPLISGTTEAEAGHLFEAWKSGAEKLEAHDEKAEQSITQSIERMRGRVLQELRTLN